MKRLTVEEVQEYLLNLMKEVHTFLHEHQLEYYLLGGSALGAIRHEGFIPWDDDIDIGMMREDYERFLKISDMFNPQYEIVNFHKKNNCDFGLTRIYIPHTYIDNPAIQQTKLDKRLYFDIFPLDKVPDDERALARYEKAMVKKKKLIQRIDARYYGGPKGKFLMKQMVSAVLLPFRQMILASSDKLAKKYRCAHTQCVCSLFSQYSFAKQVMPKEVYGTPALHPFAGEKFYVPEQTDRYLTTLYGGDYNVLPPVEKRRKGFDIYLMDEEAK